MVPDHRACAEKKIEIAGREDLKGAPSLAKTKSDAERLSPRPRKLPWAHHCLHPLALPHHFRPHVLASLPVPRHWHRSKVVEGAHRVDH